MVPSLARKAKAFYFKKPLFTINGGFFDDVLNEVFLFSDFKKKTCENHKTNNLHFNKKTIFTTKIYTKNGTIY